MLDACWALYRDICFQVELGSRRGFHFCVTQSAAIRQHFVVQAPGIDGAARVLLKCQCGGPFMQYHNERFSCAHSMQGGTQLLPAGLLLVNLVLWVSYLLVHFLFYKLREMFVGIFILWVYNRDIRA